MDGGLVQVVSDSIDTEVTLKGTIIGMPAGIIKGRTEKSSISFPDLGCVVPSIVQIGVFIAVPFIYRYVTGSWQNVWLLLMPILALILPIAVILPLILVLIDKKSIKFPKRLNPPTWYSRRSDFYEHSRRRRVK